MSKSSEIWSVIRSLSLVDLRLYISMRLMVEVLVGPLKEKRSSLAGFVDICCALLQTKEVAVTHLISMT